MKLSQEEKAEAVKQAIKHCIAIEDSIEIKFNEKYFKKGQLVYFEDSLYRLVEINCQTGFFKLKAYDGCNNFKLSKELTYGSLNYAPLISASSSCEWYKNCVLDNFFNQKDHL